MLTRRHTLISIMTGLGVAALGIPLARGDDWRVKFSTLNFGVVSNENEADRIVRYKGLVASMERSLRVSLRMHQATDDAGTVEALKARKLEFARFGPASYAQAWLVTGGKVEPIVVETDSDGLVGYHAVVVVKIDSPYQALADLKGKSFAYADPNSTSGFVSPDSSCAKTASIRRPFSVAPDSPEVTKTASLPSSTAHTVAPLHGGPTKSAITWRAWKGRG